MATACEDVMVTGRMSAAKKVAGNKVLARAGLNASQAINLMFDLLIERHNAEFLGVKNVAPTPTQYAEAAAFIDGLVMPHYSRFDTMTKAEIAAERFQARDSGELCNESEL